MNYMHGNSLVQRELKTRKGDTYIQIHIQEEHNANICAHIPIKNKNKKEEFMK
jgi:hypothetical protein